MAALTLQSTVRRNADVLGNALSDREAVMLDVERGRYFGVKDVGNVIWKELERPIKVDDLCTALVDRFDVDPETCRADVLAFLEQLLSQGLIDAQNPEASS